MAAKCAYVRPARLASTKSRQGCNYSIDRLVLTRSRKASPRNQGTAQMASHAALRATEAFRRLRSSPLAAWCLSSRIMPLTKTAKQRSRYSRNQCTCSWLDSRMSMKPRSAPRMRRTRPSGSECVGCRRSEKKRCRPGSTRELTWRARSPSSRSS